jgi:hypothetical protein
LENKKIFKLNIQEIMEFAYLTKETIEKGMSDRLSFEQTQCYPSCFYKIREILTSLGRDYFKGSDYQKITDFYLKKRELVRDFDRLMWQDPEKKKCYLCGEESMDSDKQFKVSIPNDRGRDLVVSGTFGADTLFLDDCNLCPECGEKILKKGAKKLLANK